MAKRNKAPFHSTPCTPSGKSPPKKKADTCPSDEKKANRGNNKENESFLVVAPYSVHSNSEDNGKQSSKMVPYKKDKQDPESALADYKERMDKKVAPKTFPKSKQTVVAADRNNNIAFRAVPSPPPPPPLEKPALVGKVNKKKKKKETESEWSLKPAAHQDAAAFKWGVHVKRAHVNSKRCAAAVGRITRATDKEADDVYGEILIDIGCGRFDPVKAKEMVDRFNAAN